MRFITANAPDKDPINVVRIEADDADVNIFVNEILVAWLDGDDGMLHTMALCEDDEQALEQCEVRMEKSQIVVRKDTP